MEKYVQLQDIENFASTSRAAAPWSFSFAKKKNQRRGDTGTHAGAEDPSCE
jgi:hypothetical protein